MGRGYFPVPFRAFSAPMKRKAKQDWGLLPLKPFGKPEKSPNSLYFSLLAGNFGGEGFARDWVLRQQVICACDRIAQGKSFTRGTISPDSRPLSVERSFLTEWKPRRRASSFFIHQP